MPDEYVDLPGILSKSGSGSDNRDNRRGRESDGKGSSRNEDDHRDNSSGRVNGSSINFSGLLFSRDLEVTSKASTGRILFHFR